MMHAMPTGTMSHMRWGFRARAHTTTEHRVKAPKGQGVYSMSTKSAKFDADQGPSTIQKHCLWSIITLTQAPELPNTEPAAMIRPVTNAI